MALQRHTDFSCPPATLQNIQPVIKNGHGSRFAVLHTESNLPEKKELSTEKSENVDTPATQTSQETSSDTSTSQPHGDINGTENERQLRGETDGCDLGDQSFESATSGFSERDNVFEDAADEILKSDQRVPANENGNPPSNIKNELVDAMKTNTRPIRETWENTITDETVKSSVS